MAEPTYSTVSDEEVQLDDISVHSRSPSQRSSNPPLQESSRPPLRPSNGLPSQRHRRSLRKLVPAFSRRRLYFALSIVALSMLIINIIQISLLDDRHDALWIDGFPAVIFGFGVLLVLAWAVLDLNSPHRPSARSNAWRQWTAEWWARSFAIASVILTILAPFAIMQFWYMDTIALPQFNQTQWVTSIEAREEFSIPNVNVSLMYQVDRNPNITFTLNQFGPAGHNITSEVTPQFNCDAIFCRQSWSTSPSHRNVTVNSTVPLTLAADMNAVNVDNLQKKFWYDTGYLDLAFSISDSQIDAKTCDGSDSYSDYIPWITTTHATIAFEVKQINDTFALLNGSCSDSYNIYRTTTHATSIDPSGNDTCAKGSCRLALTFWPASKIVTVVKSQRLTDKDKIIIDEAGVLGAVAFFAWFLGIYVIGIDDDESEQQGSVCGVTSLDAVSDEDNEIDAP